VDGLLSEYGTGLRRRSYTFSAVGGLQLGEAGRALQAQRPDGLDCYLGVGRGSRSVGLIAVRQLTLKVAWRDGGRVGSGRRTTTAGPRRLPAASSLNLRRDGRTPIRDALSLSCCFLGSLSKFLGAACRFLSLPKGFLIPLRKWSSLVVRPDDGPPGGAPARHGAGGCCLMGRPLRLLSESRRFLRLLRSINELLGLLCRLTNEEL
jgi:hypothetical protein